MITLSCLLTLWGHYQARLWVVFIFKPLTTTLIFMLAALAPFSLSTRYGGAVLIGLLFSLAGDIFLMLPQDHFREGLASFLIAHLFYLLAFTTDAPLMADSRPFLIALLLGTALLRLLWGGIARALRIPVVLYVFFLLAMAAQASGRAIDLAHLSAQIAALGAVLFVLSDTALAFDRFKMNFWGARAVVLTTYFLAQWLIALSLHLPH